MTEWSRWLDPWPSWLTLRTLGRGPGFKGTGWAWRRNDRRGIWGGSAPLALPYQRTDLGISVGLLAASVSLSVKKGL